jgi:hypothetical protein
MHFAFEYLNPDDYVTSTYLFIGSYPEPWTEVSVLEKASWNRAAKKSTKGMKE